MIAQYEEIHKIHNQLSEDNSKLVTAHQHTTDVRRSHLTDIHRTDGRGESNTNTAYHTIEIKHDEQ